MSLVSRFLGIGGDAHESRDADGWDWIVPLGRPNTASGQNVTYDSALALSAVYGSIRLISDGVSTLDIDTLIEWDGHTKPYRPRPAWLEFEQNELGQMATINQAIVSMLVDGNAYILTPRDNQGRVTELLVLDPACVSVEWEDPTTKLRRIYRVNGQEVPPRLLLHIPGMMLPGALKGCSPITHARESIGLGLAALEYGARFFGSDGLPGMTVEVPGAISDAGIRQMKEAWRDAHGGPGNAHKLAILTEGAKFTKLTVPPDDAQFIATRQFTVPDICRFFGVPPHLLADASGSTSWGSGLQEQELAFNHRTLRPWVRRLEYGLTRLMQSEGHSAKAFVRFDLEAATRGSLQEQVNALRSAVEAGLISRDEARAMLGRGPLPDGQGEVFYGPVNLAPIGSDPRVPTDPPTPPEESTS